MVRIFSVLIAAAAAPSVGVCTESGALEATVTYATYFGGSRGDLVSAIALDASGNVYLAGTTRSADFPATPGAYQRSYSGGPCPIATGSPRNPAVINTWCPDAFIAKFTADRKLAWATYIGGSGTDTANGIAVDAAGNIYITGFTDSLDFPLTADAVFRTAENGYILKLNPNGSKVLYASYLSKTFGSSGYAIAITPTGDVYVAGSTKAFRFTGGDSANAFITRWRSADMHLLSTTRLGGSGSDDALAMAVDRAGNVYLTGRTTSLDFPVKGAIQPVAAPSVCTQQIGQCYHAFVSKLKADDNTLLYSTYLSGSGSDIANAITVDASGAAIVAGSTSSPDFPIENAAFPYPGFGHCLTGLSIPCSHGFVTKIAPDGTALMYSTFLGGRGSDTVTSVTLDQNGNALLAGGTSSVDFPTTVGALSHCTSSGSSFVGELSPDGSLEYLTYSFGIQMTAVVAAPEGAFYAVGYSFTGVPVTPDAFQPRPATVGGDPILVSLRLDPLVVAGPVTDAGCVLNAASLESRAVSPGEIVKIFGRGIGPAVRAASVVDSAGRITAELGGTQVMFDGIPAPLLYAGETEVEAIVPFAIAGRMNTRVVVRSNGLDSAAQVLTVADTAPGIFSVDGSGAGQALALNQDGTLNSPSNPAVKGSIVTFWMTGAGQLTSAYPDGQIVTESVGSLAGQFEIGLGPQPPAQVLYAGQAPGMVAGMVQVNVRVPQQDYSGPFDNALAFYGTAMSQWTRKVTVAVQ